MMEQLRKVLTLASVMGVASCAAHAQEIVPGAAGNPAGPFFGELCNSDEQAFDICKMWVHGIAFGMEASGTLCLPTPLPTPEDLYAIVQVYLVAHPTLKKSDAYAAVAMALRTTWGCDEASIWELIQRQIEQLDKQ